MTDALLDIYEGEEGRFALFLPVFMGAGALAYLSVRSEPPWWAGPAVLAVAAAGVWAARWTLIARGVLLC
ncbi:hypothetical protein, partial [Acidisphaera rubrifaciens]|uniref:hypothetical protein n=1 Tax=Acidisphaera rubrifaciens TaxID=50715 RepID=UPI00130E23FB